MCCCSFSNTLANFHLQAINIFCVLADENEDIPPLANSKNWSNFKLAGAEWQLIQLAYNCLVVRSDIVTFPLCFHLCWSQILASVHGELSAEKMPTCHKVFLLLEKIQMEWEDLCDNPQYHPVQDAIQAGLDIMEKWYRKTDDTSIYFVSHGNVDIRLPLLTTLKQC